MHTKKLFIVHGDKGGIGKSLFATAFTEFLLARFGQACVVEGDAKIPDVAKRFGDSPEVTGLLTNLARSDKAEEATVTLFEKLEALGDAAEMVVINTPGSASDTLDKNAHLFVPVAKVMGYDIHVAWMIADDMEGINLSTESTLCAQADHKIAVINAAKTSATSGPWHRSDARRAWIESGGHESVMPVLTDRAMALLRETQRRPLDLTTPESGQSIVIRQVFKNWLKSCADGPCKIFLGEDK